jgi:hypothetical protein
MNNLAQELERLKNEQKILVDLIRRLESQQDGLQVEELALTHMLNANNQGIKDEAVVNMIAPDQSIYDEPHAATSTHDLESQSIPSLQLNPSSMFQTNRLVEEEEEDEDGDADEDTSKDGGKKFTIL